MATLTVFLDSHLSTISSTSELKKCLILLKFTKHAVNSICLIFFKKKQYLFNEMQCLELKSLNLIFVSLLE
jgi:hypothetical protein